MSPFLPCDFPVLGRAARISTDAGLGTQNSARSPSRSRSASRSWASLASSLSLCTSLLIRLLSAATRKRVRRHPPTGCQLVSAALGLGCRRNSPLYRFPQRLSEAHPWWHPWSGRTGRSGATADASSWCKSGAGMLACSPCWTAIRVHFGPYAPR